MIINRSFAEREGGTKMNIRIIPTGKLIKEYLKANQLTQRDLAQASGHSAAHVNLALKGKKKIPEWLAKALTQLMPETKKDFWLAYSERYAQQCKEDERQLRRLGYPQCDKAHRLSKILDALGIHPIDAFEVFHENLGIENFEQLPEAMKHQTQVHAAQYSRDKSYLKTERGNSLATSAWMMLAADSLISETQQADRRYVGPERLKALMEENKGLFNVDNALMLTANIEAFAEKAGIYVGFTASAPSSGIKGLTFRQGDAIYVILTNRYRSIEFTIFVFVHELCHLLLEDAEQSETIEHEEAVDQMAKDYFISPKEYQELAANPTLKNLYVKARKNNASPGVLLTLLQHDCVLDYSAFRQLLNRFDLTEDFLSEDEEIRAYLEHAVVHSA